MGNAADSLGLTQIILVIGEAYIAYALYPVEPVTPSIVYILSSVIRGSTVFIISYTLAIIRGQPITVIGVGYGNRRRRAAQIRDNLLGDITRLVIGVRGAGAFRIIILGYELAEVVVDVR